MLTSSLTHQLIGLLRQPDIFTYAESLSLLHTLRCTHISEHTHTMCISYIMYTHCANMHICANTAMNVSTCTGSPQSISK